MAAKCFMHAISNVSGIALDGFVRLGTKIDLAHFLACYGMNHEEVICGNAMKLMRNEFGESQREFVIARYAGIYVRIKGHELIVSCQQRFARERHPQWAEDSCMKWQAAITRACHFMFAL